MSPVSDFASLLIKASDNLRVVAASTAYVESVARATELLREAVASGHKILVFGNGGSAADAQHIAGELVGRFAQTRPAIAAIALGTNQAFLTAWSNDTSYAEVFAREIEGLGTAGDVAWGISTSGNSPSVVNGLRHARARGLRTIALTGADGGACAAHADVLVAVPLTETARIQEVHLVTYHAICAALEASSLRDQAAGQPEPKHSPEARGLIP
jgi:D-sedoheptulose 7-phosphate isomerase